jgi:hypothetical protein
MHQTLRLCFILGVAAAPMSQARAQFVAQGMVGAQRCGQCHAFAYKTWLAGPHAKAHLSLSAEQRADSRCSTCHGSAPDAGAQGVQKPDAQGTVQPAVQGAGHHPLVGVQCESCHGPGKYYQPDYVMRDRELSRAVGLQDLAPAQCQLCHTAGAPSVAEFNFKALWAKIDHSKAAEERAKQAAAGAAQNP